MPKTRPRYSPEFRRQMVDLVSVGRDPEDRAHEFEPTWQSIRNWVGHATRPPEPPDSHGRRHPGTNRGLLARASGRDRHPEPPEILTPPWATDPQWHTKSK